jgi:hypothetical protein
MKIEDNFLAQDEFDKLQNFLMGDVFSWYYNNAIDYVDDVDRFQFIHTFYKFGKPQSAFMEELGSILCILQPLSLLRIKANLLTKTPKIIENEFHIDLGILDNYPEKLKQWTTSIFYVNTNNGYTKFEDGTKVESVANRMITFPANMKHHGTSCTDEKIRIAINFNYFEDPGGNTFK